MDLSTLSSPLGKKGVASVKSFIIFLPVVVLCIAGLLFFKKQPAPSPAAAAGILTPHEKQSLIYVREAEQMARDLYLEMYQAWGLSIFKSTSGEEQDHVDAMLELFGIYSLQDPLVRGIPGNYSNQNITYMHTSLFNQGIRSKNDGLKACALQEEINILDLDLAMKSTQKQDITRVYSELQRDSMNHLRSFAHSLEALGERYKAVKLPQQTVDAIILDKMDRGFMLR